jgi:hypothetical protein
MRATYRPHRAALREVQSLRSAAPKKGDKDVPEGVLRGHWEWTAMRGLGVLIQPAGLGFSPLGL